MVPMPVVKAISFEPFLFMRKVIITRNDDTRQNNVNEDIGFKFTKQDELKPSTFEVIVSINGTRYQYGFSILKETIVSEWLYAFPKKKLQRWFVRDYNIEKQKTDWYCGPSLTGHKSTWKDSTRQMLYF